MRNKASLSQMKIKTINLTNFLDFKTPISSKLQLQALQKLHLITKKNSYSKKFFLNQLNANSNYQKSL